MKRVDAAEALREALLTRFGTVQFKGGGKLAVPFQQISSSCRIHHPELMCFVLLCLSVEDTAS